jgi:hypothetical protein
LFLFQNFENCLENMLWCHFKFNLCTYVENVNVEASCFHKDIHCVGIFFFILWFSVRGNSLWCKPFGTKRKKAPIFIKCEQWCICKVLLETNDLPEDRFFRICFWNTRFSLNSCQIVCMKENSYWMKTTYPVNFF